MIQGLCVADDEHAVAGQDVRHHTNIPGQESQPEYYLLQDNVV